MVGSNSFFTTDMHCGSMNNMANSQFFWFFKPFLFCLMHVYFVHKFDVGPIPMNSSTFLALVSS